MYLFLLFGPTLGFLLLTLTVYPSYELGETRRAFLRGAVAAIPVWLLAHLLGSFVPLLYGSVLIAVHEWADRFLPFAVLPGLAYLVFYRLDEPLRPGSKPRRITSFYAGAICPLGVGEMVRVWGHPDAYELFVLPILFVALFLAVPRIFTAIEDNYGARRVFIILGGLAASFAAACSPWIFLLRFWPLAWILALGMLMAGWGIARGDLGRRPPLPFAE